MDVDIEGAGTTFDRHIARTKHFPIEATAVGAVLIVSQEMVGLSTDVGSDMPDMPMMDRSADHPPVAIGVADRIVEQLYLVLDEMNLSAVDRIAHPGRFDGHGTIGGDVAREVELAQISP